MYDPLQFERLFKLVEFNTLLHIETIKRELELMVERKRNLLAKRTNKYFKKMNDVVKFCNKFKESGSLRLRVNEKTRTKLILSR